MKKLKVLFVCTMNRMRSRTAEDLYKNIKKLEVRSAGTALDAENVVTPEMVNWADIVFCFETYQYWILRRMCKGPKEIVNLKIPDQYPYMSRALIVKLLNKLPRYLGGVPNRIIEELQYGGHDIGFQA